MKENSMAGFFGGEKKKRVTALTDKVAGKDNPEFTSQGLFR